MESRVIHTTHTASSPFGTPTSSPSAIPLSVFGTFGPDTPATPLSSAATPTGCFTSLPLSANYDLQRLHSTPQHLLFQWSSPTARNTEENTVRQRKAGTHPNEFLAGNGRQEKSSVQTSVQTITSSGFPYDGTPVLSRENSDRNVFFDQLTAQLEQVHQTFRNGLLDAREYHQRVADLMVQLHTCQPQVTRVITNPTNTQMIMPVEGSSRVAGSGVVLLPNSPYGSFIPSAPRLVSAGQSYGLGPPVTPTSIMGKTVSPILGQGPMQAMGQGMGQPLLLNGIPVTTTTTTTTERKTSGISQKKEKVAAEELTPQRSFQPAALTSVALGPSDILLMLKLLEKEKWSLSHNYVAALILTVMGDVARALAHQLKAPVGSSAVAPEIRRILTSTTAASAAAVELGSFASSIYKALSRSGIKALKTKHNRLRLIATEGSKRCWKGHALLEFVAALFRSLEKELTQSERVIIVQALVEKLKRRAGATGGLGELYRAFDVVFPGCDQDAELRMPLYDSRALGFGNEVCHGCSSSMMGFRFRCIDCHSVAIWHESPTGRRKSNESQNNTDVEYILCADCFITCHIATASSAETNAENSTANTLRHADPSFCPRRFICEIPLTLLSPHSRFYRPLRHVTLAPSHGWSSLGAAVALSGSNKASRRSSFNTTFVQQHPASTSEPPKLLEKSTPEFAELDQKMKFDLLRELLAGNAGLTQGEVTMSPQVVSQVVTSTDHSHQAHYQTAIPQQSATDRALPSLAPLMRALSREASPIVAEQCCQTPQRSSTDAIAAKAIQERQLGVTAERYSTNESAVESIIPEKIGTPHFDGEATTTSELPLSLSLPVAQTSLPESPLQQVESTGSLVDDSSEEAVNFIDDASQKDLSCEQREDDDEGSEMVAAALDRLPSCTSASEDEIEEDRDEDNWKEPVSEKEIIRARSEEIGREISHAVQGTTENDSSVSSEEHTAHSVEDEEEVKDSTFHSIVTKSGMIENRESQRPIRTMSSLSSARLSRELSAESRPMMFPYSKPNQHSISYPLFCGVDSRPIVQLGDDQVTPTSSPRSPQHLSQTVPNFKATLRGGIDSQLSQTMPSLRRGGPDTLKRNSTAVSAGGSTQRSTARSSGTRGNTQGGPTKTASQQRSVGSLIGAEVPVTGGKSSAARSANRGFAASLPGRRSRALTEAGKVGSMRF